MTVSKLVVNSDEEYRKVGKAIERAQRCARHAQSIIEDLDVSEHASGFRKNGLFNGAITWWQRQRTAWVDSKKVLQEGAESFKDLEYLVYWHMIRNNLTNHRAYEGAQKGCLDAIMILRLLEEFGYELGIMPVSVKPVEHAPI